MDTQQYWLALKRRWLPASIVFVSISIISAATLVIQKNIYEAEGRIRFTRGDRTTALTGVGKELGQVDPLIDTSNPMTTEIEVIRSVPIIQATIRQLDLRDQAGEVLSRRLFLRNLSLISTRGADILQVFYRDDDSARAKAVVDTLMQAYLKNHLQENRAEVIAARKFIEQQLPEAEASVQEADAALRKFQERNHVAALDEEKRATVSAIEDLRRRVAEAKSELANASAQSATFGKQLDMNAQEAIVVTTLSQSPGVQEALKQFQGIESQLAIESVRFQDDSPIIRRLQERRANVATLLNARVTQTLDGKPMQAGLNLQIGELKASLAGDLARAEVRRMGLANQVAALTNAQEFYQQRISALPRLEQEQRELIRRLEAAQTTYSLLKPIRKPNNVCENGRGSISAF